MPQQERKANVLIAGSARILPLVSQKAIRIVRTVFDVTVRMLL